MRKKKDVLSYLFIILGAIMASFSVALILLPNDAIDYGTAGVAIIISKLSGVQLSTCVLAVFIPFIIAGYIFLGKQFTVKAALGSIVYTAAIVRYYVDVHTGDTYVTEFVPDIMDEEEKTGENFNIRDYIEE